MAQFHVNNKGEVKPCRAKPGNCRFQESEHFDTESQAQKYVEQKYSYDDLQKEPVFDALVTDYGLCFEPPPDGFDFSVQEASDGAMFYRSPIVEDISMRTIGDEFETQRGYSLDIELYTLQKKISPQILNKFAKKRKLWAEEYYTLNEEDDMQSVPTVLVMDDKAFVVDGNHRFAVAKSKHMKTFDGLVFKVNESDFEESGYSYTELSPEEFNDWAKNVSDNKKESTSVDISGVDYSWRSNHRPDDEGPTASNIEEYYPDFYEHPDWYRSGDSQWDKESTEILKRVKDDPNAKITMYRSIPDTIEDETIYPGDWVTFSKTYAKDHYPDYGQENKVISKTVRAKDLRTPGDSINEWGYFPEEGNK